MATRARTPKEIENDFKRIKKAAKTATTMKELEQITGLTSSQVSTTLSKHPNSLEQIKIRLSANRKNSFSQNLQMQKFVIDTSISGFENLKAILFIISNTNSKIILTSITIKELEKLQNRKTDDSIGARYILNFALENMDIFESVLIDETVGIADDCIINYCAENKNDVILLTSDKTMALKAKMYSVQVCYLKKYKPYTISQENLVSTTNSSDNTMIIRTLIPAKLVNKKLVLPIIQSDIMSISLYSNGTEYHNGTRELHIDDYVFISTKKENYLTFAHYRIISLEPENNCELIYSTRFYNYKDIDNIPVTTYKSFLQNFRNRLNQKKIYL